MVFNFFKQLHTCAQEKQITRPISRMNFSRSKKFNQIVYENVVNIEEIITLAFEKYIFFNKYSLLKINSLFIFYSRFINTT